MQIYYIYIYIYITYKECNIYSLLSEPPGLGGSDDKECHFSAGGLHSISGLRRSPGEGNGYLLQYSVFLPGESQGQRRPASYSPCGREESATIE